MDDESRLRALAEDVRAGLSSRPMTFPPKHFYDAAGSALFDRITRLPEYYLTRAESEIFADLAPGLVRDLAPTDIVELGSGSSAKLRKLLDPVNGDGRAIRYVPVDVDRTALAAGAAQLVDRYAFLRVHAVVGDFERHLGRVPPPMGRRLVLFLGSTIGNLDPDPRHRLLREIRALLHDGDRALIGFDLVKDVAVIEAAYNDSLGVTRDFNRNVLAVVNRGLNADFQPHAFDHLAFYNVEAARIEMHLVAQAPQTVRIGRLDLTIRVAEGERIWTENSYKFTEAGTRDMLEAAGLDLVEWRVDSEKRFGLALAAPARPAGAR
jgi:L-histidine N-alpha-methyltransferase